MRVESAHDRHQLLTCECMITGAKSPVCNECEEVDEGQAPTSPSPPGMGDTPRRRNLREMAFINIQKQAGKMQRTANRKDGVGELLQVGTVVSIPIADVDRAKVDSTTATAVVVEVVWCGERQRAESVKYRLACRAGVLKSLRHRSYVHPLVGVTPRLVGLQDALTTWKTMPEVGDRSCARFLSSVGGQGLLHCACTGNCLSGKCSCYKAGRECNSRCHKSSAKCRNLSSVED